eukprot:UN23764
MENNEDLRSYYLVYNGYVYFWNIVHELSKYKNRYSNVISTYLHKLIEITKTIITDAINEDNDEIIKKFNLIKVDCLIQLALNAVESDDLKKETKTFLDEAKKLTMKYNACKAKRKELIRAYVTCNEVQDVGCKTLGDDYFVVGKFLSLIFQYYQKPDTCNLKDLQKLKSDIISSRSKNKEESHDHLYLELMGEISLLATLYCQSNEDNHDELQKFVDECVEICLKSNSKKSIVYTDYAQFLISKDDFSINPKFQQERWKLMNH